MIRGKFFDTIEEMISDIPPSLDSSNALMDASLPAMGITNEWCQDIYRWSQDIMRFHRQSHSYPTWISTEGAIWRSMIANGAPWTYPAPAEYFEAFQAWIEWLRDGPDLEKAIEQWADATEEDKDAEMRAELEERYEALNVRRIKSAVIDRGLMRPACGRVFCRTK
jgi:hypothetical protein